MKKKEAPLLFPQEQSGASPSSDRGTAREANESAGASRSDLAPHVLAEKVAEAVEQGAALPDAWSGKGDPARRIECPPPGIYHGVPFRDYHAWDAISASRLEPMSKCPAWARYRMLHPEETKALDFGNAFHAAILEPMRYETDFAAAPTGIDRRYTEGKLAWSKFAVDNAGKILLKGEEHDKILAMREAIWDHPTAFEMLRSTTFAETSLVWKDEATGRMCKARVDKLAKFAGYSFVVDLKSVAGDADAKTFSRTIANYGYHRQAAWYVTGANVLAPRPRRFAFIAVEKEPPYLVAVHELTDADLEQGAREMQAYLRQWCECEKTDTWPGLDPGLGLVSLPTRAQDSTRRMEE